MDELSASPSPFLTEHDALNRRTYHWPIGQVLQPLLSVTTIIDTLHDRALEYVRNKMIASEAVLEMDYWQDMTDEAAISYLAGAANRLREERADKGTRLHELIAQEISGGISEDTEWYDTDESPYLDAAVNFCQHFFLEPIAAGVELKVANPKLRYAGTIDMLCHNKVGQLWCIDWKTGKKIGRAAALQMVALSHTTHYQYRDRSRQFKKPFDIKVVVKLQENGTWRIYRPKIEEPLWRYFQLLIPLAYWDKQMPDTVGELYHSSIGGGG